MMLPWSKKIIWAACCAMILSFLTWLAPASSPAVSAEAGETFLHPGMLYPQDELDRMKRMVSEQKEPWYSSWNLLQANPLAKPEYRNNFHEIVYRNDLVNGSKGNGDLQNSASAALLQAVEWAVTGDRVYADNAIRILNGWSNVLTSIQGRDAQLAASLYGYKLLNAAEIIRHTDAGWAEADIVRFTGMMYGIFYPIVSTYGQVNGGWANGNWDAADTLFVICLGVFADDESLYKEAVDYFKHGEGNGSLLHYVQTGYGQLQESGRDQAHSQLGIGLLSMTAEIGYNQRKASEYGADMVSYPDNSYLLLKGAEYAAQYGLGYDVPYTPLPGIGYTKPWWPNEVVSPLNRGQFRPMYHQIWSLYRDKLKLPVSELKYTKEVLDRYRLDVFYLDHPSYGGLLDAEHPAPAPIKMNVSIRSEGKLRKDASTGTFLSAPEADAPVTVSSLDENEASMYEAVYWNVENRFAFRSRATGLYLSVQPDGTVLANATEIGDRETFLYAETGNGNGTLRALSNGLYIAVDPVSYVVRADKTRVADDYARWILLYPERK
ncbi:alginate lyase family protein [Paenibacillus sp. N4]|uniref:alginate lyase family protein n=1 Tax=Paenibacillus vietnamensis TaxID=2590547 RepID=UPI001CD0C5DA|nr:alginate lyase family protein [Paenibacillus vietnamensis]MCA0757366.1 alginate lyase family protein [Paenibacillus vietnamensis]